jgi:predicted RNase H-like HicB family nuclease
MTAKIYEVIALPSSEWWSLEVPSVPGAISQGRTHEEVVFMATDAISMILEIPKDQIQVQIHYQGSLAKSHI